jgi:integrase
MSVRKREWVTRKGEQKTAWVADFVDNAGRRQIRTFANQRAAKAFHSKVTTDINTGLHVTIDPDLTVLDAADKWISDVKANGAERSTIRQYDLHVKVHIGPRIGLLKLARLTVNDVKNLRNDLLQGDRKLSLATAHKVFVSFKSLLKANGCGHLADNISIKKGQRSQKLESNKDYPTPDEVRRIVIAAGDNMKLATLLRTAALTGLRASELLGLRWADVDFKRHEIHVRQRSDRYRAIGAPKSATSIRTIPIGPDLAHVLKEWKLACPKGEADLAFPNREGVGWHYDNVMRRVNVAMIKAGVVTKDGEPKYALHAFRHFFASWCINPKDRGGRELPPKLVQEWLGHSSIKLTLDLYGHMFPRPNDKSEIATSEKALFLVGATQP